MSTENNDLGRAPAGQALVNEAATHLHPAGFDPSRITEVVELIEPSVLAPLVRKAADDFYEQVMDAAQDYLRDNMDYNLKAHLEMLERQNRDMRLELFETRKMVGNPHGPHADTLQAIALLDQKAFRYQTVIWEVDSKFEGEERHETALRYIKQAEAAQGMETGTAETLAAPGEA